MFPDVDKKNERIHSKVTIYNLMCASVQHPGNNIFTRNSFLKALIRPV